MNSDIKELLRYVAARDGLAAATIINLSNSLEKAALLVSEAVDYLLGEGEFAHAYYLLGIDCVSKLDHPAIDYSRVVTLSFCGKHEDGMRVLEYANKKYPEDESLNNLQGFFAQKLDVRLLYC
jgi:hypothetical protein